LKLRKIFSMRALYCMLILAFGTVSCQQKQPQKQSQAKASVITFDQLMEQVIGKEVQLIDLRTDDEYKAGFIDDAIQMNFLEKETFIQQIETLDKSKPVYVYCHSGGRSGRATKLLKEKGFLQIFDYSGGYSEWSVKSKKE